MVFLSDIILNITHCNAAKYFPYVSIQFVIRPDDLAYLNPRWTISCRRTATAYLHKNEAEIYFIHIFTNNFPIEG